MAAPRWLWSGKNLRGSSSSLEQPILPVAAVDERELHSKSAKSKSSKAKSSKSKSSKISLKSGSSSSRSSSSSSSSKGSKSYTSTSKSGKSKSSKGSSDSKSAKGDRSDNSLDTEGSDDFHNTNSSNDKSDLSTEYETIIPTTSAQVNTSSLLHDNMDLPGNPDESAISSSVPDSDYTTVKIAEGSHDSGSDESIPDDAITDDAVSYDVEPIILDGDLTTEVRIAEGESEFIDSEVMGKGGPNDELIEDEAILDFSSESLE